MNRFWVWKNISLCFLFMIFFASFASAKIVDDNGYAIDDSIYEEYGIKSILEIPESCDENSIATGISTKSQFLQNLTLDFKLHNLYNDLNLPKEVTGNPATPTFLETMVKLSGA